MIIETSFVYVLREYTTTRNDRVYSPYCHFGGFRWRLLIFPNFHYADGVSAYLHCGGPCHSSNHAIASHNSMEAPFNNAALNAWSRTATFWLAVLPPSTEAAAAALTAPQGFKVLQQSPLEHSAVTLASGTPPPRVRKTEHNFKATSDDWGFLELAKSSELQPGKYADDHMNVFFHVRIQLAQSLAQPRIKNVASLRSGITTQIVGIENQGATCYMTSVLQMLYMIGAFRRAVYELPLPKMRGEGDISGFLICYAIQSLFYELLFSGEAVKTDQLLVLFGWDDEHAQEHHDLQEFKLFLCEQLAQVMSKRAPEQPNTLRTLFQGKTMSSVECINVDYNSSTEEYFSDLSLDVMGCRNIYESFEKYTKSETLTGDNKYDADGYDDLQEAIKVVKFLKLPPVLHLHLKRFDYDCRLQKLFKINDRYEFGAEINLSRFVFNSDGDDVYVLHSVLVHGYDKSNVAQYQAFIRPYIDLGGNEGSKWYNFNDEKVRISSEQEAIQDNFGGCYERVVLDSGVSVNGSVDSDGRRRQRATLCSQAREANEKMYQCCNAYMLQYVRKADVPSVLKRPEAADVPEAFRAESCERGRRGRKRRSLGL